MICKQIKLLRANQIVRLQRLPVVSKWIKQKYTSFCCENLFNKYYCLTVLANHVCGGGAKIIQKHVYNNLQHYIKIYQIFVLVTIK